MQSARELARFRGAGEEADKMAAQWLKGTVKAVPSGDTLIIMSSAKGSPPPEKSITLANLIAPRLVRTVFCFRSSAPGPLRLRCSESEASLPGVACLWLFLGLLCMLLCAHNFFEFLLLRVATLSSCPVKSGARGSRLMLSINGTNELY